MLPLNSLAQYLRKLVNKDRKELPVDEPVLPGDILATAEEYIPGRNTDESGGYVVSLAFGSVRKDEQNLSVAVMPARRKKVLRSGQTVYGLVTKVDQRKASVRIGAMYDQEDGLIQFNSDGYVNLSQRYERNPSVPLRIGDMIRAKVQRTGERGTELTILGRNLGVVRTLCPRCRLPMTKKDGALYCDNCEKSEIRKVTQDYGDIEITGEIS